LANPHAFPPWGAITTATSLRADAIDADVVDLNGRDISEALPRLLEDYRPDALGVTGKMGLAAERALQTAAVAKKWDSRIRVVLGGPVVDSFGPEIERRWTDFDAFLPGDGEAGLVEWVTQGCPSGLRPVARFQDLDRAGIPGWWSALREYVGPAEVRPGLDVPSLHVASSRGCTGNCRFCYLSNPGRARGLEYVSSSRLVSDLELISERFGATGFFFVDDCFLDASGCRLASIEACLSPRSDMRFGCDLQLWQLADQRLLERLATLGFRSFYVGLEAGSTAVCRNLGKRQPVEGKCMVIRRALDDGFVIRSSVGVGWPGETEEDIADTFDLLTALPEMKIDAFRYTPLPHAPLTDDYIRAGGSVPSVEEWPFLDFCFRSRNFSGLPDEVHEAAWESLIAVQDERHGLVSMGGDLVSRSEYDRADSQSRPIWTAGE